MREFLYALVELAARAHGAIMRLNDSYELYLSDKMLHFLVIGLVGMLGVLLVYPLFLRLSRRGHIMAITWIYVFTLVLVLAFAIEIGQKISGTGSMEFADIVFGAVGFLAMFLVFDCLRGLVLLLRRAARRHLAAAEEDEEEADCA